MSNGNSSDEPQRRPYGTVFFVVEFNGACHVNHWNSDDEIVRVPCPINFRRARSNLNDVVALLKNELFMLRNGKIYLVSFFTGARLGTIDPPAYSYFGGLTNFASDLFVWTNRLMIFYVKLSACLGPRLLSVGRGRGDFHGHVDSTLVRILRRDWPNNVFEFAYNDPVSYAVYRVRCNPTTSEFISQEIIFTGSETRWVYPVGIYTNLDEYVIDWDRGSRNLSIVKLVEGGRSRRVSVTLRCQRFYSAFICGNIMMISYRTCTRWRALSLLSLDDEVLATSLFARHAPLRNIVPFYVVM